MINGPDGTIRYANPAAVAALGREGESVVGAFLTDLLDEDPAASAGRRRLPSGDAVHYLGRDVLEAVADARWSRGVAEALAGLLNVRRTLARIADLAVPDLGAWCSVTLVEHDQVRQAERGPGVERTERTRHLYRLDAPVVGRLRQVMAASAPVAEPLPDPTPLAGLVSDETRGSAVSGHASVLVCAPMRAHGRVLGLIAVAVPGEDAVDLEAIEALARRGAVALSAAQDFEERSRLTATLRSSLLPASLPTVAGLSLGAAYRPAQEATEIGGDFYEVRPEGSRWSFSIGDVCGKGVEAAVLTGQVRQSLRTVALVTADPAERLRLLNEALLASDGTSFVTAVHGTIELGRPIRLSVAAGGHPAPLLLRADGRVEAVGVGGPIIGMIPDVRFKTVDVELEPGDMFVVYTDGLSDARGGGGLLGDHALADRLGRCVGLTAQAIADGLLDVALEHLAGGPHDDMAVLVVGSAPDD